MNLLWHIINIFFFLIGCYLSIFSAFLFDAPDSTSNPYILSLFYSIISIPILSICGFITGNYIFPLLIILLFTGWITLLVAAISSVPFTTIKYNDMKHRIYQALNSLYKR
jgi:hypothetical protein